MYQRDQFRFTTHTGVACEACERMVERNAVLAIAVRRLAAAVHRAEHHGGRYGWPGCSEAFCLYAREVLEEPKPAPAPAEPTAGRYPW
jgi:hypothetical protein